MNTKISLLAIIEILSSLSIGVIILFITYKTLKFIGRKKYDIQHNNQAYSIFMASILFSVGFMVSSVLQPILSSFRILSTTHGDTSGFILSFLGYGALYVFIAFSSAIVISLVGISIYSWLTPIDEFKEIKDNNIGVAIIVSSIIVTLIIMSKSGVTLLIESIIPYPMAPPR
ncbi:DUF350 domain-containing protein [Fulvivirgaceae bacterium BMA10]|uniref:DUF350 domain-containing protein n=1 Tax=Splendidivirga corallicola TaxID=3051826 RepID=A0ABT8KQ91_9BACT|nr:DUF350 domain-containing protein [Fulvivirgaceae bacterium BMA10]